MRVVAMHLEEAGIIFHKKKHFTQLCHTPPTTLAKLDKIEKMLFSLPSNFTASTLGDLTSYLINRYVCLLPKITATLAAVSSVNSVGR